ncbi:MAG TPA: PASTA domain-containing protein [Spirochaetia bacterium]|nr:PASTA domain-containing protein [Spirochaetia bacterium]
MKIFDIAHNIFSAIGERIKRMLPNPKDSTESKNFKTTVYLLIGGLFSMLTVAVIAFMAYVQPLDETVIPNLTGEDFREAVIVLQNKKLIPYLDFQFTNSPEEKDKIMNQDPKPREKVRIGSRVTLVVSKGITYDRLGNYIGKPLPEVEKMLATLNRRQEIVILKKPINYISHRSPAGTVIAQNPNPGAPLSDQLTQLELTVSKGQGQTEYTVGNYLGRDFTSVISDLQRDNIAFVFVVIEGTPDQAGKIVSQNVPPESTIDAGAYLLLEMVKPNRVPEGKIFGVYTYNIPEFGAPVLVKVEAEVMGRRSILLSQERFGGRLTLPYILDREAEIFVTVAGEEKQPEKAQPY